MGASRRQLLATFVASVWVLLSLAATTPSAIDGPPVTPGAAGLWNENFDDCSLDRVYPAYDDHDAGSPVDYGDRVEAAGWPQNESNCAVHIKAISDNGFAQVPITPRAFVSSPYIDDWDTSRDYGVAFRVKGGAVAPQRLTLMAAVDFRILITGQVAVINSTQGEFELPPIPAPDGMLPAPLFSIAVAKPPPPATPSCEVRFGDAPLGSYPCGGASLEPRTLLFGDLGDEPGYVNNKGEAYWDDVSLEYARESDEGPLAVDAGPDLTVDEGEPFLLEAVASGGGAPQHWEQHTFGFDIVVSSAPEGSWVTEYVLGGTPRPGIVAVTHGSGRAVFGPDDGLTGGGLPGGRNYQIFANAVLWASGRDRPEGTSVLMTWGHKDILFYHSGSRNLVGALRAEGFRVDVVRYVPADLSAYDAVVLAMGWDYAGYSQQGVNLGYCSIASAGCPAGPGLSAEEVDAVLAFVEGGGGLVASAERDSGDDYLNPVSQPMGVTFADLTSGSYTAVKVADHPILERWGTLGGPPYAFAWDLNDLVDSDADGDPRDDPDAAGVRLSHVYGDDGVYSATVVVTDSAGATATDAVTVRVGNRAPSIVGVAVTVTGSSNDPRTIGYWRHQCSVDEGAPSGDHRGILDAWIQEIGGASRVFRDIATKADACAVLNPNSPADVAIRARQQLMALWLNVASGKVDPQSPVNLPALTSARIVAEAIDDAESVLLGSTDAAALERAKDIADSLNNGIGLVAGFVSVRATATDPGSDDLYFMWDWGDGSPVTSSVYYNDGAGPDPPSSPDVNPIIATDVQGHVYTTSVDVVIRLTVRDDDSGSVEITIHVQP